MKPKFKAWEHEIIIRDQVIHLRPPIEEARAHWYRQLHEWLAVVCKLTKNSSYAI